MLVVLFVFNSFFCPWSSPVALLPFVVFSLSLVLVLGVGLLSLPLLVVVDGFVGFCWLTVVVGCCSFSVVFRFSCCVSGFTCCLLLRLLLLGVL